MCYFIHISSFIEICHNLEIKCDLSLAKSLYSYVTFMHNNSFAQTTNRPTLIASK